MPYFKCVACKIRVSEPGAKTELTHGTCPGCGEPLEPAGQLSELVGFRSPNLHDDSVPAPIVARVVAIDGRASAWPHDGGVLAAAVAARAHPDSP